MTETRRILCIDYGRKFTGLAVADFPGITARALDTIRPDRTDAVAAIERVIAREKVTHILLGFPYSDAEGEIHREIRRFKTQLERRIPIPIEFTDESWSSQEAEELMRFTRIGKRRKNRAEDSEAAKLVLLRYLESGRIG